MGAQVVNAVVVVDAAIFFHFVVSAKTVFDNKQRPLIIVGQLPDNQEADSHHRHHGKDDNFL